MLTDGLKADHQAHLHPELRAVPVSAPFTRLEKAYFFRGDPVMKDFIDAWLSDDAMRCAAVPGNTRSKRHCERATEL